MRIRKTTKIRIEIHEEAAVRRQSSAHKTPVIPLRWRTFVQWLMSAAGFGKYNAPDLARRQGVADDSDEVALRLLTGLLGGKTEAQDPFALPFSRASLTELQGDARRHRETITRLFRELQSTMEAPPMALVIENREHAIYLKILAGEADEPLIYIDGQGHIHVVGGGDSGPELQGELETAAREIRSGVDHVKRAVSKIPPKKA